MPWRAVDSSELSPAQQAERRRQYDRPYLIAVVSYYSDSNTAAVSVEVPASSAMRRRSVRPSHLASAIQAEVDSALGLLIREAGQLPPQIAGDTGFAGQADESPALVINVRMYQPEMGGSECQLFSPNSRGLRRRVANGESIDTIVARVSAAVRDALGSPAFGASIPRN